MQWNQVQQVRSLPTAFTPKIDPLHYVRPPSPATVATAAPIAAPNVPKPYQASVAEASAHTGIPVQHLTAQFTAENGGNWDPKLRGRTDPTDFGVTQLNPVAVKTITGATPGGVNFFKKNYGHEFNPADPNDQILASGVYLNYLRQYGLPAAGVQNPSDAAVMTAYNTGATGYARAQAGDVAATARANMYRDLLRANGATSTR